MQGRSRRIYLTTVVAVLLVAWAAGAQAQQPEQPATTAPAASNPAAPPAAAPVGPDEVVLTIGDMKITAAEFNLLSQALPPDAAAALTQMGKKGFAERYANLVSLAKEGEKRKVDENPMFRQMAAFQRTMLLAQLTVNDILANMAPISPEEVSYYYTSHPTDFQQLKLRGVYIPFADPNAVKPAAGAKPSKPPLTEAEAKAKAEALRMRIRAGESMANLAKKESDHATAANGGDFGLVRRGQFAPQIDSVIFALEVKQVSVPVRDRFGYFIFQIDEKRVQPLEEAKSTIENALRQQKVGEALNSVQSAYPVTFNPRFFNEAAPAPAASPAQGAPAR